MTASEEPGNDSSPACIAAEWLHLPLRYVSKARDQAAPDFTSQYTVPQDELIASLASRADVVMLIADGTADRREAEPVYISYLRAKAVTTHLASLGVSRAAMGSVGHGTTRPCTTDTADCDSVMELRVELSVLVHRDRSCIHRTPIATAGADSAEPPAGGCLRWTQLPEQVRFERDQNAAELTETLSRRLLVLAEQADVLALSIEGHAGIGEQDAAELSFRRAINVLEQLRASDRPAAKLIIRAVDGAPRSQTVTFSALVEARPECLPSAASGGDDGE